MYFYSYEYGFYLMEYENIFSIRKKQCAFRIPDPSPDFREAGCFISALPIVSDFWFFLSFLYLSIRASGLII